MDSLPDQPIDSLAVPARKGAYEQLARFCLARSRGVASEEELAQKAGFYNAEVMRISLKNWGLSVLLPSTGETTAKGKGRKKTGQEQRRKRSLGPAKELPAAGAATELFIEKLEELIVAAMELGHRHETLRGKHFDSREVYPGSAYLPREAFSDKQWRELCEQHHLDPRQEGFLSPDSRLIEPAGATQSPSEPLTTLIGVLQLVSAKLLAQPGL